MGFLTAMSPCCACERVFSYNPNRVPSVRIDHTGRLSSAGERRPICEECIGHINVARAEKGLQPFPILPGAYEPAEEGEIVWD